MEKELDREVTFVVMEPTGDGIVRYLSKRLRNDTIPEITSSTREANIIECIPEISSETYV